MSRAPFLAALAAAAALSNKWERICAKCGLRTIDAVQVADEYWCKGCTKKYHDEMVKLERI